MNNPFKQSNNIQNIIFTIANEDFLKINEYLETKFITYSLFEKNSFIIEISIYLDEENELFINQLKNFLQTENISINNLQISHLDDHDWVEKVQKEFRPILIKEFFIYSKYYQDYKKTDKINIQIDPGRAFGTGEHQTTKLCLSFIAELDTKPESALDLGCGSAILAIALLKKFPESNIYASDIDEVAIQVAKENANLNNADLIHFIQSDGFENQIFINKKFDLIVANILLNPLIDLAKEINKKINKNGYLILSGFTSDQIDQIINIYIKNDFKVVELLEDENWNAILLKKIK